MKKLIFFIILLLSIIIFTILFFYLKVKENSLSNNNKSLYATNIKDNDKLLSLRIEAVKYQELDIVFGSDNAPLKIIEYISYGCPYCAEFYQRSYKNYFKRYIDSGKVQLIIRDFPLDEPSLRASQLVHCTAKDKQKKVIKTLFEKQASWAHNKNFPERLENIAKISGMVGGMFHECMTNKVLEESILEARVKGYNAFQVHSTPTIIINGNKYIGLFDNKQLPQYLDKLLNNIKE